MKMKLLIPSLLQQGVSCETRQNIVERLKPFPLKCLAFRKLNQRALNNT